QLANFKTSTGQPFRLLPLPWPQACYEGTERLPATYANFLVINKAVLVPTYQDPADAVAIETIGKAFPGREVIGIDCRALIQQHGSLHCISMQLPHGVLA
ncbi:MAG: agmatine deiminase family protein, partial [Deltaproteobacteria bacterium]|nr:agmatine deiminase family protein [Deltaproteobacteria bacterium]